MKKFLCVLVLIFFMAPLAFAGFTLKAGGGIATFGDNDYNKGTKGYVDYYDMVTNTYGGTPSGDLNGTSKIGLNFSLEGIFNFTRNLGVGLEVGYFQTSA
ncbi:MAG: hypothetical protein FJY83_08050, partial [Candidatus Aminicenantes bacterium]|nr:hypothetical protein [Candidatus Aminicenantes bacterium]